MKLREERLVGNEFPQGAVVLPFFGFRSRDTGAQSLKSGLKAAKKTENYFDKLTGLGIGYNTQ